MRKMDTQTDNDEHRRPFRFLLILLFLLLFLSSISTSPLPQVIPQLGADGRKAAPDLPSFLLKERIVYLVRI